MGNKFETRAISLSELENTIFLIPPYQRPYVWGHEQVNKLIDSFHTAYLKNEKEDYFIGTVVTSPKHGKSELIDGQQRFTTLWLIAVSFKILENEAGEDRKEQYKTRLTEFLEQNKELRFDFAIRDKVRDYLNRMLGKVIDAKWDFSPDGIQNDEYLKHIGEALDILTGKIDSLDFTGKSRAGFGNYVHERVKFVHNIVPEKYDLNLLFTTMNNSGVQLEQSDILKSKLLWDLNGTENKPLYSKMWEACENMGEYFEKNVRQLFRDTNWDGVDINVYRKVDPILFTPNADGTITEKNEQRKGIPLEDILKDLITDASGAEQKSQTEQQDEFERKVKSILTFPQLLIHAYRVHLKQSRKDDIQLSFDSLHLLDIFKPLIESGPTEVMKFLECLWNVRWAFDEHIIKWTWKGEDKERTLVRATFNPKEFRPNQKAMDAQAVLQSVLYFTGDYNTQMWLTPYLYYLVENPQDIDSKGAMIELERIDNELSVRKITAKDCSWNLMDASYAVKDRFDFVTYLNGGTEHRGTGFGHYWFYKLEYVLWKHWENNIPEEADLTVEKQKQKDRFDKFRITSKSSIEHVHPQHDEKGVQLEDATDLDSFGNLALLSPGENSSYSNQFVAKKKVDFDEKKAFDSLKLAYIYLSLKPGERWTSEKVKSHQRAMIKKLKNHYPHELQNAQPNQ